MLHAKFCPETFLHLPGLVKKSRVAETCRAMHLLRRLSLEPRAFGASRRCGKSIPEIHPIHRAAIARPSDFPI